MKELQIIILMLATSWATAQDGSDIIYFDAKEIDSSLIGKFIQIDFHKNSFGSNKLGKIITDTNQPDFLKKFTADTVTLSFLEKQDFKEIRNDDHLNNWFSQQYLEGINEKKGLKLRVQKMKLLNISKDSLTVKLFGHYFKNEQEVFSKYLTDTTKICREEIYQILVDANPPIRKGLSIYKAYNLYPDFTENPKPDCYYCFESNEDNLFNYSLLSDYHIEKFDYENQQIILTEIGQRIIRNLEIPLQGLPVVMTLNGEIIYGFWFWNNVSSFGCDRVYTYPKLDFKIKFGLPQNNTFGNDPRFNERLKKYSEQKKNK